MDLSLQSSRNANSPLKKNSGGGGHASSIQQQYVHKTQQQQQQQQLLQHGLATSSALHLQQSQMLHGHNNYQIHNLSANSEHNAAVASAQSQLNAHLLQGLSGGHNILSPPSLASPLSAPENPKYLGANGSDCEPTNMLPPSSATMAGRSTSMDSPTSGGRSSSATMRSPNNGGGLHYMRDNMDVENYSKMSSLSRSYDSDLILPPKPIELINKELMFPSLLTGNQNQMATKKHSPLRSYHGQHSSSSSTATSSSYNSPSNMKINGPHTPPPPSPSQSPMHLGSTKQQSSHLHHQPQQSLQQSHTNMDFNQYHLQQQHHSSYSQHHNQQQQQHLMNPAGHLNYAQQQQQSHIMSPLHLHKHQDQQQHRNAIMHLQHTQASSPPHQQHHHQQKSLFASQQSMLSQHKQSQYATNHMESLQHTSIKRETIESSSGTTINNPTLNLSTTDNAYNDEDTSSSNSNSCNNNNGGGGGGGFNRPRRKGRASKIIRMYENMDKDMTEHISHMDDSLTERIQQHNNGNAMLLTPESPPPQEQQADCLHRIPGKMELESPMSPEPEEQAGEATIKRLFNADDSPPSFMGRHSAMQGHHQRPLVDPRIVGHAEEEEETIDKIAEMIAKTSQDANSNASIRSSGDGGGGVDMNLTNSPKTKKQRQAMRLRNAAEYNNSNSSCSLNSRYSESNVPPSAVAANDNAMLCNELRKENDIMVVEEESKGNDTTEEQSPRNGFGGSATMTTTTACGVPVAVVSPLSPQSNSRSSTSSSSTSSYSRSTVHSSSGSKSQQCIGSDENSQQQQQVEGKPQPMEQTEGKSNEGKFNGADEPDVGTSPSKLIFEEVENKLEAMFAGMEDDPRPLDSGMNDEESLPKSSSEVVKDLSAALGLATPVKSSIEDEDSKDSEKQCLSEVAAQIPARRKGPTPTKAAMKSTVIEHPIEKMKESNDIESKQRSAKQPKRTIPTRRLSMVKVSEKQEETVAKVMPKEPEFHVRLDDEKPSTSAAAAAALAAKNAKEEAGNNKKTKSNRKRRSNYGSGKTRTNIKRKGANNNGSGGQKNKKQKLSRKQQNNDSSEDEDKGTTSTNRDSGNSDPKYKSPFILIKKDGSISVINAPTAEDVSEKQTKVKKPVYAHEHKRVRGMHSSTLSNKYDADTTDSSWICVFCKRGPHKMGLGDLFGPYLISNDCEEYKLAINSPDALDMDALFASKRKRTDMLQTHPRNLPVVPAKHGKSATIPQTTPTQKNRRKKADARNSKEHHSPKESNTVDHLGTPGSPLFLGMSKSTENNYEIWVHEDCIVWAADVFLVGARVMGLETAVWNSLRYQCLVCHKAGAVVCCLQRECKAYAHVPCARESMWHLEETNFKVYCDKHRQTPPQPSLAKTLMELQLGAAAASFAGPP